MQFSRSSERRGSTVKVRLISLGVVLGLIGGGAGIYFSGTLDPILSSDEAPAVAQAVVSEPVAADAVALAVEPVNAKPLSFVPAPEGTPTSMPTVAPQPTSTPEPVEAPSPTVVPTTAPTQIPSVEEASTEDTSANLPAILPVAEFGEVLSEGLLQLDLPGGEVVDTWYTFQVDTKSHEITLLFAVYNEPLDTIISTATIPNYTEGAQLEEAIIALKYPDGLARTIWLDRVAGTITVNQQYSLPYGPSMFSPELRLALVYYGINLLDESQNLSAAIHLDLSGLSEGEGLTFQDSAPTAVETALDEIQELVSQVEKRRSTN